MSAIEVSQLVKQFHGQTVLHGIDLEGGWLVPGFIDTQVNGGGGVLFNDMPTVEGIAAIAEQADVVILTNLQDQCQTHRVEQLAAFGIEHRVVCNQGGKGAPVSTLVAEYAPMVAVFVDDLPVHHQSVADHAPDVWRLHMVSEPQLAAGIAPASAAHARIDDWQEGRAWIEARFAAAEPAPPVDALAAS